MITTVVKYIFLFFLILLLQVVVANNISFWGIAPPMIYIYYLMLFPYRFPRISLLTIAFVLGLCVDMFSNTIGLNVIASVTTAYLLHPLAGVFNPRGAEIDSFDIHSLGSGSFLYLASTLIFIHHFLVFILEYFSYANLMFFFTKFALTSAFTIVIVFAIENIKESIGEKQR